MNKYERFSEHASRVPDRYTLGRGIEDAVSSDNIYSAQQRYCLDPDCDDVIENTGEVGLCKYHSVVYAFSRYWDELPFERSFGDSDNKLTNVDVFGTLTFAPKSVSPTNLNFRFEDTGNGHLNDPPVGIQRGTKCYKQWEASVKTTFGSSVRRILAVTEYGSNNNTGRLHIHYIMRVLTNATKRGVSQLLYNLEHTSLGKRWPHGHSIHEQLHSEVGALGYISKYVMKDFAHDKTVFWTLKPEPLQGNFIHDDRV